jgi:predicted lipoprotein
MKKMSRPLANFGQPRPYFAESWRSETSMLNLKANIEALQALYIANDNGLDKLLRQRGKSELADSIRQQFTMTIETWPTEQSLFDLLQSKDGYRLAYSNYNKLEQLKYLIHEEVAIELGVVIGFNATDGD